MSETGNALIRAADRIATQGHDQGPTGLGSNNELCAIRAVMRESFSCGLQAVNMLHTYVNNETKFNGTIEWNDGVSTEEVILTLKTLGYKENER